MPASFSATNCAAIAERSTSVQPLLTVMVPCHNEAESLPRLFFELDRLESALQEQYELEFLLVDDGSRDATWEMLLSHAAERANVRLAKHDECRGIAAALATGISQARGEIVASLDADCTYEPLQLVRLLRLLTDGVDVVVASPYHPAGEVVGVPRWRLALSQLASRCYRLLMHNKLHTYTSCVRVYRKAAVADVSVAQAGFVGVVELLWRVDQRGGTIVECPAVLAVRTTGQSKMRLLRTSLAHARFLFSATIERALSFAGRGRRRQSTVQPSLTPQTP
jgi:dolichol-phosphate mannosyltransferase